MKISLPFTFTLLCALALSIAAQAADDACLSPENLAALRASYRMDDRDRAFYNAVTSVELGQLTLNREILSKHNDFFSNKIKTAAVTDQHGSGRCWLFAGLNVFRPQLVAKHKLDKFELSENYLAFWDKIEKANCFLEDSIELADRDMLDRDVQVVFSHAGMDDGWWEYVSGLIQKYGAVPKEIMPETHASSFTGQMNRILGDKLRADAVRLRQMKQGGKSLKELRAEKAHMLADLYRVLVINLGEPPQTFSWRYEDKEAKVTPLKSYTPQSFWKEWIGAVDFDDYVQLANVPGQDYGKQFRIEHTRNIEGGPDIHYLNVEIGVLKAAALKSVLDKQPVWFAADVGKDQDPVRGIMAVGMHDNAAIFGDSGKLTKAQRWSCCAGGPNHAMVLMGVDVLDGKPSKWLVENSWGKEKGHDGYWSLYDDWFDEHLYMLVVKKEYLPKEMLKLYEQPAVLLPRWHPMAQLSD